MRMAITGATGLLGANIAAEAVARGDEVVCTRRAGSSLDAIADLDAAGAIRWVEAPLSDSEALARAFDGCEIVVHCAASTSNAWRSTPELVAANIDGTRNVLDAVRRAGVLRLVHTSSTVAVGVTDDPAGAPCTEDSPYNLAAHGLEDGYAATKREGEQLVLAAARESGGEGGLDAVVVNPGFMFGPRDARPTSGRMILEVGTGRARIATPGRNCFVDVRDVAHGILLAAERGERGERYILGGENLPYGEVFARIAAVVGGKPPLITAPWPLAAALGLVGDTVQWATGREQPVTTRNVRWGFARGFVFDSAKARRALGYETRPLEEGIAAAWAWFGANGRR
jgi:dihydroflavonol-4-reductase